MGKTLTALTLASACGAALCGVARADVIYTFTTTSMNATPGTVPAGGLPLTAMLDLTTAQVQSGSFVLDSVHGNDGSVPPPDFTGDVGGFSSIIIQGEGVAPNYLYGDIAASFTFDAAGDVASSNLRFLGVSEAAQVSGTGNLASGYVGSDNGSCGLDFAPAQPTTKPGQCSVSGYWSGSLAASPVPEPATFALLGAGLLGLAARRRAS